MCHLFPCQALGDKNRLIRKKGILRWCGQAMESTAQSRCALSKALPLSASPAPSLPEPEKFKLWGFVLQNFQFSVSSFKNPDILGDVHATAGCSSLKLKRVGLWVQSAALWWLVESSSSTAFCWGRDLARCCRHPTCQLTTCLPQKAPRFSTCCVEVRVLL